MHRFSIRHLLATAVLSGLAAAAPPLAGGEELRAGGGLPRAQPEAVGMSAERLARLTARMEDYVAGGRLAGTVTAVARRGRRVHFEAVGALDVEGSRPMRDDAIFRIYSMTKPITGVAVLMLYEEGKLLLTEPIARHLPALGSLEVYLGDGPEGLLTEPARPMTIRQVLTHTSGLSYDEEGASGVPGLYHAADLWAASSLEDFVGRVAALPLAAQPGAEWHYSVGMDVLGRLVEVVAGVPFDRFLAERIFAPLGMVDTAFYVPQEKRQRFAVAYRATAEGGIEPGGEPFDDPAAVPFGGSGLVSTAADFLRFAQMLANGGELDGVRLLAPKTVELMMSDHLGRSLGPEPLAGFTPWLQSSARGVGFGLTGAVITDVAASGVSGSEGLFFWGGAASTFFWVDRREELVGLLLTQLSPSEAYPLRAEMRVLVYQALVE